MSVHSPPDTVELGRGLARALTNTGITVIYQDTTLTVAWARNVPASWPRREIVGLTDEEFLPAADLEHMLALKRKVLESGQPERIEMRQASEAGSAWYDVWLDADRAEDGQVIGLVTTMVETTGHKQREQTLRTLLREVSHRSKNLLAIIQSIATQTGRYSGSIDVFLTRFRGRLQSLSSSQDLVTSSNWRGAMLSELVEGQISKYCEDPAYSVRLEGVDPHLSPNATLHIGLALHELIVNSMSYGALSRPNGFVTLHGKLGRDSEGRRNLVLTWLEKADTDGKEQPGGRFGSVALERVVPASLDGEAVLKIAAGDVTYRLTVPQGNFEIN